MLYVFFFFYVIFAGVHVCKLKRFIDYTNISIRMSRFFLYLLQKNDQYNTAFEEDTQTKH
jgi:hypothetical protein